MIPSLYVYFLIVLYPLNYIITRTNKARNLKCIKLDFFTIPILDRHSRPFLTTCATIILNTFYVPSFNTFGIFICRSLIICFLKQ